LWLSHDVIPAGIATQYSDDVHDIREQSRMNLQSLRMQYEQRRSNHQRNVTVRGESDFEKWFRERKAKKKIAAEEAARAVEKVVRVAEEAKKAVEAATAEEAAKKTGC